MAGIYTCTHLQIYAALCRQDSKIIFVILEFQSSKVTFICLYETLNGQTCFSSLAELLSQKWNHQKWGTNPCFVYTEGHLTTGISLIQEVLIEGLRLRLFRPIINPTALVERLKSIFRAQGSLSAGRKLIRKTHSEYSFHFMNGNEPEAFKLKHESNQG